MARLALMTSAGHRPWLALAIIFVWAVSGCTDGPSAQTEDGRVANDSGSDMTSWSDASSDADGAVSEECVDRSADLEDFQQSYTGTVKAPLRALRQDGYIAVGRDEALIVDGHPATFWQSPPVGEGGRREVVLRLGGATRRIRSLRYLPRQDGNLEGTVLEYEVYLSTSDGCWGTLVQEGTFAEDREVKTITFGQAAVGGYLRFVAKRTVGDTTMSAAEFEVDIAAGFVDVPPPLAIAGDRYSHQLRADLGGAGPSDLIYELVEGPPGLSVSRRGLIEWTPDGSTGSGDVSIQVSVRSSRGEVHQEFAVQLVVPQIVATAAIGPDGGTLSIVDSGTPLDGVSVSIPAGAVPGTETFTVGLVDEHAFPLWDEAVALGPGLVIRPIISEPIEVAFPSEFPAKQGSSEANFYLAGWTEEAAFQSDVQTAIVPHSFLPDVDRKILLTRLASAYGVIVPADTDFIVAKSDSVTLFWALGDNEDSRAVDEGLRLLASTIDDIQKTYASLWSCESPAPLRVFVLGVSSPFVVPTTLLNWIVLNKPRDRLGFSFSGLLASPPVLSPGNLGVLAHEYFHTIQQGYVFERHSWFGESTAVFAEDEVFDDVNSYRVRYAPWSRGPVRFDFSPNTSALSDYQSALFFKHLNTYQGFNPCQFYDRQRTEIASGVASGNLSDALDGHLRGEFPMRRAVYTAAYQAAPARRNDYIEEIEEIPVQVDAPKFQIDCRETRIFEDEWVGGQTAVIDIPNEQREALHLKGTFRAAGSGAAGLLGVVLSDELEVLGTLDEEEPELELAGPPKRLYVVFVSPPEGPGHKITVTAQAKGGCSGAFVFVPQIMQSNPQGIFLPSDDGYEVIRETQKAYGRSYWTGKAGTLSWRQRFRYVYRDGELVATSPVEVHGACLRSVDQAEYLYVVSDNGGRADVYRTLTSEENWEQVASSELSGLGAATGWSFDRECMHGASVRRHETALPTVAQSLLINYRHAYAELDLDTGNVTVTPDPVADIEPLESGRITHTEQWVPGSEIEGPITIDHVHESGDTVIEWDIYLRRDVLVTDEIEYRYDGYSGIRMEHTVDVGYLDGQLTRAYLQIERDTGFRSMHRDSPRTSYVYKFRGDPLTESDWIIGASHNGYFEAGQEFIFLVGPPTVEYPIATETRQDLMTEDFTPTRTFSELYFERGGAVVGTVPVLDALHSSLTRRVTEWYRGGSTLDLRPWVRTLLSEQHVPADSRYGILQAIDVSARAALLQVEQWHLDRLTNAEGTWTRAIGAEVFEGARLAKRVMTEMGPTQPNTTFLPLTVRYPFGRDKRGIMAALTHAGGTAVFASYRVTAVFGGEEHVVTLNYLTDADPVRLLPPTADPPWYSEISLL